MVLAETNCSRTAIVHVLALTLRFIKSCFRLKNRIYIMEKNVPMLFAVVIVMANEMMKWRNVVEFYHLCWLIDLFNPISFLSLSVYLFLCLLKVCLWSKFELCHLIDRVFQNHKLKHHNYVIAHSLFIKNIVNWSDWWAQVHQWHWIWWWTGCVEKSSESCPLHQLEL